MQNTIFSVSIFQWGMYHWLEFGINYFVPLVGCVSVIIGGVWAAYKYFNEKKRSLYCKILEKVYAPLFEILIHNEYSRKLKQRVDRNHKKLYSVKSMPFFKYSKNDQETDKDEFEEKLNKLSSDEKCLHYAPCDLVFLLKAYQSIEEKKLGYNDVETLKKMKKRLQKKIRANIIMGFKRYKRRLGYKNTSIIKPYYSIRGILIMKI